MKTILHYLAAALVLFAAASCAKEIQPQTGNEPVMEGRVVVASFAANDTGSKSSLDGSTPKWAEGDKVMISDGKDDTSSDHCREYTLMTTVTNPATEAQIVDGGAKFMITIPSTFASTFYAVYPSSSYKGITEDGKQKFEIPQGQYGTFAGANICAAKNEDCTLCFKNVASIIEIKAKTSPIHSVQIYGDSVKLCGIYDYDYTTGKVSESGSLNASVFSVLTGDGPFFIAVAPVTLPAGALYKYFNSESMEIGSKFTDSENNLEISRIYKVGTALDGMLPKPFTINSTGVKVYFAKGNLQASIDKSGEPTAWKFADTQSTILGSGGANTVIGSSAGDIDYFGWSSSQPAAAKYGISLSTNEWNYAGPLKDWGEAYCDANGITPASTWRTLTDDEWNYILTSRSASKVGETDNARFVKVKIDGVKGLLLFPDTFVWDTAFGDIPNHINSSGAGWSEASTYAQSELLIMQVNGAVFLPVAGYRSSSSIYKSESGYYWANHVMDSFTSYALEVSNEGVNSSSANSVSCGLSVRLVTENK